MNKWGWTAPCRNPCMHIQLMETFGWVISLSCFIKEWKSKVQYLQMTKRNIKMYRGEEVFFFFFFPLGSSWKLKCMNSVALEAGCLLRKAYAYLDKVLDSAALAPTKLIFIIFYWDTSITNPQKLKGFNSVPCYWNCWRADPLRATWLHVWHVRQQIWLESHCKDAGVMFTGTSVVRQRFKWLINVYSWPKPSPGTGTNPRLWILMAFWGEKKKR